MEQYYKPKVLIVDDIPTNLFLMSKILQPLDAHVFMAASGEEALSLTLRHQFSVILLDVQMPNMDGFETASLIRSYFETKCVPIIFVTAIHKNDTYILRGYEVGAVDYLFKPVDRDILVSKVKVFLELDRQRHALEEAMNSIKTLGHQKEMLLECAGEGIVGLDSQGRITFMNPAALSMLGFQTQEIRDLELGDLFVEDDPGVRSFPDGWESIRAHENQLRSKGNRTFPVVFSSSVIRERGLVTGGVMVFLDISERKKAEQKLLELANYDHLTKLPNRTTFRQQLEKMISRNKRYDRKVSVIFLDLDNFKGINDSMGHDAGDALLKGLAKLLIESVRDYDVVARLAGDEFGILLEGFESARDVIMVGQKILERIQAPFTIQGRQVFVTCSLGIATFPESGTDPEALIKAADIAMYEAKREGKDTLKFFDQSMQIQARQRMELEGELRHALNRNELSLHFQPQVDPGSHQIKGMEALLRWNHPTMGSVSPAKFIPLAEETGLILPIGEWVMQQACIQAASWHRHFGPKSPRMAVNVSPRQLKKGAFLDVVQKVLAETSLPPGLLEIELTESTIMEDSCNTITLLEEFHRLGLMIAVDDFGTGYSSLSYLTRLPVDVLKIDRSFVSGIGTDLNSEVIIRGILSLAESMELNVVAEGVEDREHLEFFQNHPCQLFQGYYFHKPMTGDQATALLKDQLTRRMVSNT
ncbi:EAL domain-containing protein [Sulfidibacter corallicola]|uniref:EAL domain-containing protein n=1 Tax=Sulfidibacter corallicola TaxID=2818388 RepID=A0A8A4TIU3_SULCO|nr:EAL domain-containing protein [Sulfidibacter corallicola]QTD49523.1 EAL domain-containing protein [Sulfidibacter corallicola]